MIYTYLGCIVYWKFLYLDNILNKRTWRGMRLNRLMEKDTETKTAQFLLSITGFNYIPSWFRLVNLIRSVSW